MDQKTPESFKSMEENSCKEVNPAVNQDENPTTEAPIEIDKELNESKPKEKKDDLVESDSAKDDEDDVMF